MNYKIVETSYEFPDVLLYKCPVGFEEDEFICKILAYGQTKEEFTMAEEFVEFGSQKSLEDFIKYYTEQQAVNFCTEHKIKYL